jgi:hypothetical protein
MIEASHRLPKAALEPKKLSFKGPKCGLFFKKGLVVFPQK